MTNEVNTARSVRVTATVPEICMHNVKLGPGCFCPHCPTASIDDLRRAVEPVWRIGDRVVPEEEGKAAMRAALEPTAPSVINAEGSQVMMELFNRMPVAALKAVPDDIAKRVADFMVANGYRFVFDRWYLQAEPKEPERSALNRS